MTSRLTLICQGATATTRASAFPADEPLEERSLTTIAALRPAGLRADCAFASPAQAARQTAAALSLGVKEDPRLRDVGYGRWAGRTIAEVGSTEPERIAQWIADPGFDGHGGESIVAVLVRAGQWLDGRAGERGHTLAIVPASVLKAMVVHVLDAPAQAFWRLDMAPLSLTDLRHDGRRWALRTCGAPLARSRMNPKMD